MLCNSQVGGMGLDWKPLREIAEDAVNMLTTGKKIPEVESMIDTRLNSSNLEWVFRACRTDDLFHSSD